jgi:hypothetical protein
MISCRRLTVTHGASGERPDLEKVLLDEPGDPTCPIALSRRKTRLRVTSFPTPREGVRCRSSCLDRTLERAEPDASRRRDPKQDGITPEYCRCSQQRAAAVPIDHPYMPRARSNSRWG